MKTKTIFLVLNKEDDFYKNGFIQFVKNVCENAKFEIENFLIKAHIPCYFDGYTEMIKDGVQKRLDSNYGKIGYIK